MSKATTYREKRNFEKTAEPAPNPQSSITGNRFVIQKHAASHLHFDLRLELSGTMKSWAVPKGPNADPSVSRLAMQVEDHPVDYSDFEGTIPKGEYGGGTVMIWDQGFWHCDGVPETMLTRGHVSFLLLGERMKGRWALTRIEDDEGKAKWRLNKKHDNYALEGDAAELPRRYPTSVTTGRSMEHIADGRKADAKRPPNLMRDIFETAKQFSTRPENISPQLAGVGKGPPNGNDWIHEIKFDGYRLLAVKDDGTIRLLTRNQQNWTDKFPSIAEVIRYFPAGQFLLDGEVVAMLDNGVSDFQTLQNTMRDSRASSRLVYWCFDLPMYERADLRRTPLDLRKQLLHRLVMAQYGDQSRIRYSDHIIGNGMDVFRNACGMGLEGIISKRRSSLYEERRSRSWLKSKCTKRQEFVIGGYTAPKGSRKGFGALVIGYFDSKNQLTYCGRVGTGFDERTLKKLYDRLKGIRTPENPFEKYPSDWQIRDVQWVRPELIAEIEYTHHTDDRILRYPAFKALRSDKNPVDVRWEELSDTPKPSKGERMSHTGEKTRAKKYRINISNPDRILYPEQGITKQDMAEYYLAVADVMLPHVANRPLTMLRCPSGYHQECFFQKHLSTGVPEHLRTVKITEKSATRSYAVLDSVEGLMDLVQMGVLEIHPWGSTTNALEYPDRITFDLDPGEGVSWESIIEAAHIVRDKLDTINMPAYLKTTGGKGLHIVVPLLPYHKWPEVKKFTKGLAHSLARENSRLFTATVTKSKRTGKVYLDYVRNSRGATAVAPYSTRARKGATVSLPIDWDILSRDISPTEFNVQTVPAYIDAEKDPWKSFERSAVELAEEEL